MATPAAVLQVLVTANTASATASLTKFNSRLKGSEVQAGRTSSATSKMGTAASLAGKVIAGGLAYGLYKGVKAGIDFEKQMDNVGAVANASTKEMKALEKQALKLGQSTVYSAGEVATAQEELVKGGLKVKQVLGGALPAALQLAAAGQLDLGDAASTTVNAMKLFELKAKDAVNVADMLATAANTTTADVSDFAMALRQGGSAAKAAGLDMNDTVTILEALAEAGIKNSDAGTSMKTALLQLIAPTEKQAALAKQLGLSFVDQNGNLKDAAGLSSELREALGGMTNAQQAANLKVLAGTDGFRTLSALYDAGPAKLDALSRANERQGTAQEIAKKKMDNTAGSLEQLSGALETLSIKMFQSAQSPFRDFIDGATKAVQKFTDIVTDKNLTSDEKISKVLDMVSTALKDAIPKIADAAAKVGTAILKGIGKAFIEGDTLTKLFIGASAIRLFGGPGVFASLGAKMAGWLFAGFTTSAAAGGAATGAGGAAGGAAAGGILAGARVLLPRAGMMALGVAAAAELMHGISDGIKRKSGTVQESLDAIIPDSLSGPGLIEGIFGASDETKNAQLLKDTLSHILKDKVGISEETRAEMMRMGKLIGLNEEQLAQADQILGYGDQRLKQSEQLSEIFRGMHFDLSGQDLLPQKTIDQVQARLDQLGRGLFTSQGQIATVMKENRKNIMSLNQPAAKTGKMLGENMRAGAEAMRRALHNGSIKGVENIREARKKIRHLLRSADLVEGIHPRDFGAQFAKAIKSGEGATKEGIDRMVKDFMKMPKEARNAAFQTMMAQLREYHKGGQLSDKEFKDIRAKLLVRLKGITDDGKKQSGLFNNVISGNFGSLASNIFDGLTNIGGNVAKALKSFDVDWKEYTLQSPKKPQRRQRGGHINTGAPSGDSVPALLERDEYVLNRNAVAKIGKRNLDALNFGAAARFQKGGSADGSVLHLASGGVVPAVSEAIKIITGRFPLTVTSTTGGGHAAGSYHYQGKAVDLGGSPDVMNQAAKWIGQTMGSSLLEGIHNPNLSIANGANVPSSYWGAATWADHIDHIHIALDSLGKMGGAIGAKAQKLKKVLLKGPDGPLKDMGQSALDKVRAAGNKFIAKQMPKMSSPDLGSGALSEGEFLQLARRALTITEPPGHGPDAGFPPTVSNAHKLLTLAIQESGLNPSSQNNWDSNAAAGIPSGGLMQVIPPTFKAYHEPGTSNDLFDPIANIAASINYQKARYGDLITFSPYATGGLVEKLAGGGGPGDKDKGKGHSIDFHVASGLGVPITEAQKIARKLKKLTAGRGAIAKLDERISIADTLANADDDLSAGEIDKLVGLNRKLLVDLKLANKLSGAGYRIAHRGIGSASGSSKGKLRELASMFRDTQTDMSGVTGKGGRIFDTRQAIADLRGTASSAGGMDISGLLSVIEAAQFGAFQGQFGTGGKLGPNQWGIAGDRGPEVVRGPATIHSNAESRSMMAPDIDINVSFDGYGADVEAIVNGVLVKRERHEREDARAFA